MADDQNPKEGALIYISNGDSLMGQRHGYAEQRSNVDPADL